LANSTIRIAFFAARPMSTTRPICVKMLLSRPAIHRPATAASRHSGTMRMITSGSDQLSYWAASTRNTNSVPSTNTAAAVLPARHLLQRQLRSIRSPCPAAAEPPPGRRRGGERLEDRDRVAGTRARKGVAGEFR
jgi:hypothetical protein